MKWGSRRWSMMIIEMSSPETPKPLRQFNYFFFVDCRFYRQTLFKARKQNDIYLSRGTALTISLDADSSKILFASASGLCEEHKFRFDDEFIFISLIFQHLTR